MICSNLLWLFCIDIFLYPGLESKNAVGMVFELPIILHLLIPPSIITFSMSLATKKQRKHSGLALILRNKNKSLANNIHHATSPHTFPSQSLKMCPDVCIQCLKRIREN